MMADGRHIAKGKNFHISTKIIRFCWNMVHKC